MYLLIYYVSIVCIFRKINQCQLKFKQKWKDTMSTWWDFLFYGNFCYWMQRMFYSDKNRSWNIMEWSENYYQRSELKYTFYQNIPLCSSQPWIILIYIYNLLVFWIMMFVMFFIRKDVYIVFVWKIGLKNMYDRLEILYNTTFVTLY